MDPEELLMREIRITPVVAEQFGVNRQGERITLNNRQVSKDFLKRVAHRILGFKSRNPLNALIMPKNCRYYRNLADGSQVLIVEEDPMLRTILLDQDISWAVEKVKNEGNEEKYGLKEWLKDNKKSPYKFLFAFPHIIYALKLTKQNELYRMHVFLRTTPIRSLSDNLITVPLPNVGEDGAVCMGSVKSVKRTFLQTAVEGYISAFWNNIFNTDLPANQQAYQNTVPEFTDFFHWQYLSNVDPMCIYMVEWIKSDFNLNSIIHDLSQTKGSISNTPEMLVATYDFDSFASSFHYAFETDIEDNDDGMTDEYGFQVSLKESLAESKFFNSTLVYVGDKFKIKNKVYFIDCFLTNPQTYNVRRVRLYREDGKNITVKLTEKVEDLIEEQILSERYSLAWKINGETFKRNDVISMNFGYGEVVKIIKYFRYGLSGNVEMVTKNGGVYLLSSIEDKINKLDLDNLEFCGVKLEEKKQYIIPDQSYGNYNSHIRFLRGYTLSYDSASIHNNEVRLTFYDNNGRLTFFSPSDMKTVPFIIESDNVKKLPRVFRMGSSIYTNEYEVSLDDSFYQLNRRMIKHPDGRLTVCSDFSKIAEQVMFNNGNTFFIASDDEVDTIYNVGDRVVMFKSFEEPMDMLKVRTIIGFSINKDEGLIRVSLEDKDGEIEYYDIIKNYGYRTPSVRYYGLRHITHEYNGIKAGTKIKASKTGICGFPKKDVNMIVGFLTDTGIDEPLVLCSNCLTYWADDLQEDFELYERSNPRWKNLKLTPFSSKRIKLQSGDLFRIQPFMDSLYVAGNMVNSNALYYVNDRQLAMTGGSHAINSINSDIRRRMRIVGFLSPRYTAPQIDQLPKVDGVNTGVGTVVNNLQNSHLKFATDERRIIHC